MLSTHIIDSQVIFNDNIQMIKAKTKFEIVVVGIIIVTIGYMAFSSKPQQVEAQRTVVIDGDLYRVSDLFRSERLSNSKDIRMLFEEKNGMMLVGKGLEGYYPNTDGVNAFGGTRLYFYNNDGTPEKMVSDKSDIQNAIFDKNAENIIYDTKESIIYIYNIKNGKTDQIVKEADGSLRLSLDGKNLLYQKRIPGNNSWTIDGADYPFAIFDLNTRKEKIISNITEHYGYSPIWTPDGKRILFFGNGIELINIDGTERTKLTQEGYKLNIGGISDDPLWSSDGRYFLYHSDYDIMLVELDIPNKRVITAGPIAYGVAPRWAEEGKTISVLSPDAKAGAPALSIIDLNGKVLYGNKSHEKDYYSPSKGAFRRVAPRPVSPPLPPEPAREIPWKLLSPELQKESKNTQSIDIPKEIPAGSFKSTTQ